MTAEFSITKDICLMVFYHIQQINISIITKTSQYEL